MVVTGMLVVGVEEERALPKVILTSHLVLGPRRMDSHHCYFALASK